MTYVFRNNTIERFMPAEYQFSGYADVSQVPEADQYVWWYQLPMRLDEKAVRFEVESYLSALRMILTRIGTKPLLLFTMDVLYDVQCVMHNASWQQAVDMYNADVMQLGNDCPNVKIIDIRAFYRQYAAKDLLDWKFYFMSQMGLNPRLAADFKQWYQRQLNAVALKRKKCLVLDLDNTLWGGILGEDGVEGVQLSGDYPGKAYHLWQEGLKELKNQGVILCINSKNNVSDVETLWSRREDMVLKKDDFSAMRINWQDKATNLQELANELNIGLDAMVFVDDNPNERELIKQSLPMVSTPDWVSQPYELPSLYQQLVQDYFHVYSVTAEDLKKTEQYKQNAQRAQAKASFADMDSYLQSLEMHLTIEKLTLVDGAKIARAAQMTQKTNQFNLTTRRYMESDICDFIKHGQVWILSVRDKFGDNGISGLMIVNNNDEVDTLLMSCRVLGRGIETAFVKYVIAKLKSQGVRTLRSLYIPTEKNSQVKEFWTSLGFATIEQKEDESVSYSICVESADTIIKNFYIIN